MTSSNRNIFRISGPLCRELPGIHRSPVNSPRRGQWHGALMFPLLCVWINGWTNTRVAGDLKRHHAHYDVTVKEHICWLEWDLARVCLHNADSVLSGVLGVIWYKKGPFHYMCDFKNVIFNLALLMVMFRSYYENSLTDVKSTLVQVMAWCPQATGNYPSQ